MKKASTPEATAKKRDGAAPLHRHQTDGDFKGRFHNLDEPCCDIARTTISRIIQTLNPSSTLELPQSETKQKSTIATPRTSQSASCLTVLTVREVVNIAEKEKEIDGRTTAEGINAKKKKKKKKKKKQLEREEGKDIENAKSCETDNADRDEASSAAALGPKHIALVPSSEDSPGVSTALVCASIEESSVKDNYGNSVKKLKFESPATSCINMLFPSEREYQNNDILKEAYPKRSLSDFLVQLSDSTIDRRSTSNSPHPSGSVKRKETKAKQRPSPGRRVESASEMSTPSFGTLKEVHQQVDTIHCKVCKRNCHEILTRLLDKVHRSADPITSTVDGGSHELSLSNGSQVELSLLPSYPTKDGLAWTLDDSSGDKSSNVIAQPTNSDIDNTTDQNSSKSADEYSKARQLVVKLFLKNSKNMEPIKGYQLPEYENVLLLLPYSLVHASKEETNDWLTVGSEGHYKGEVGSFLRFFASSLLPLGYDKSFMLNSDNNNFFEHEESSKRKDKSTNAKKVENGNPFFHLKWKKEIYAGHLFENCSPANFFPLKETFSSQHRLAHLDLQFKDLVEKRKSVISNLNQIKNELDSVSPSLQEVGFRQGSLLRGVDNELYGLFGKMTTLLIDITKLVFCTYVTSARVNVAENNARSGGTDEQEIGIVQGSFLNADRSAEIQKAAKELWMSYDRILWKYTSHAIHYRGEHMYGWQYGDGASNLPPFNGSYQDASVILGTNSSSHYDENGLVESAPRITFTPQLYCSPYLRTRLAHMLERQLDEVNVLYRELEFFFRLYLTDVTCWAEHHRKLIPELPPFNGVEEELALLRLGLAQTINKGTVHEMKSEQSERDHHLREVAFTQMDELLERENARVSELVDSTVLEGRSYVSQEELQGINEWKRNFDEEYRTIRMKIMSGIEEMKSEMKKAIGNRDLEFDNNSKGQMTEGSIKKQHNTFEQTTTLGLKFSNGRVSLTLARWRLLSEFYAQYYYVRMLIESREKTLRGQKSFGRCGHEDGARRRIAGIVGSLLYNWLDQRCSEWNADEMQRELLEGFDASSDNPPANSTGGAKPKKKKKKDNGRSNSTQHTIIAKTRSIPDLNDNSDKHEKELITVQTGEATDNVNRSVVSDLGAKDLASSARRDLASNVLANKQKACEGKTSNDRPINQSVKPLQHDDKSRLNDERGTPPKCESLKMSTKEGHADLQKHSNMGSSDKKTLDNPTSEQKMRKKDIHRNACESPISCGVKNELSKEGVVVMNASPVETTSYYPFVNDVNSAALFLIAKVNMKSLLRNETPTQHPAKVVFL